MTPVLQIIETLERKMTQVFYTDGTPSREVVDDDAPHPLDLLVAQKKRIAELEEALKPFADAVYNDNGDVTITHVAHGHYLRAWRLLRSGS